MATNEILTFAGTDTGTNLLTQAEYTSDSQRAIGNQPGIARSKLVNKAMRQSTLVAAALAQYMANRQAVDVVDTKTVSELEAMLVNAIAAQISAAIPSGVPAGTISYFAASSLPTGYIKANGATISRTTYAALFSAIGTTYGAGDGSTTFKLPDLRGEFLRGWDDGRGVDSGRGFGTAQLDAFQGHGHDLSYPYTGAFGGTLNTTLQTQLVSGIRSNYATDPQELGSYGTPRLANETRARNIALLACIKY